MQQFRHWIRDNVLKNNFSFQFVYHWTSNKFSRVLSSLCKKEFFCITPQFSSNPGRVMSSVCCLSPQKLLTTPYILTSANLCCVCLTASLLSCVCGSRCGSSLELQSLTLVNTENKSTLWAERAGQKGRLKRWCLLAKLAASLAMQMQINSHNHKRKQKVWPRLQQTDSQTPAHPKSCLTGTSGLLLIRYGEIIVEVTSHMPNFHATIDLFCCREHHSCVEMKEN